MNRVSMLDIVVDGSFSMSSLETICDAARKLSVADRLQLLTTLWGELSEDEQSSELSREFQAELNRRIDESKRHPDEGRPWREVLAELRCREHATGHPAT